MPRVEQQRQELRLVEAAWDNLALLSTLSRLSSQSSAASHDLGRARQDFAALSAEMMRGLATEGLNKVLDDLGSQAQVCIDIVVRNLFERSADIGFFATDAEVIAYLAQPEPAQRPRMEAHLRAYASKYTVYRDILLLDPQGQCLARLRPTPRPPAAPQRAEDTFLTAVLASPQAYVQAYAVHHWCDPTQPSLVYAQSVQHAQKVCGVLCLVFDLQDEARALFASLLQDSTAPAGGAVAVLALVDPDGYVITSSDTLQLPPGWQLPEAAKAGAFALQHMGRRYVAVVRDTTGFQGYQGLGWRGLALVPLDLAFDDGPPPESSVLMRATSGHAELLPGSLRQIPHRSAAIQSALERSVWNGLLELNQIPSDGSEAHDRDVLFAKTLLSEIGTTAQQTAQAFATALRDLHQVVMASVLRDTQSRASLAMQILDRNLYERANDCRWWALTSQFALTLQAGTQNCPAARQTLQTINALYTVYTCLVLFDQRGQVIAVSNDQYADQVGQVLTDPWVAATLRLRSSQDYVVSDLAPNRFCPQTPTYIYAAAIRASRMDAADGDSVIGGIAVVWDAAGQMQSILQDCAADLTPQDTLMFLDATGQVVHAVNPPPQDVSALTMAPQAQATVVELQGQLYGLGHAEGPGYREFGRDDNYCHGLRCLALRHLCPRMPDPPQIPPAQTTPHLRGGTGTQTLQLATFNQGSYWLGLDADLIQMAAPDGKVLAASSMQAPFTGIIHIQNKVYPVLDLRHVVADSAATQDGGERQLIVLKVPLEQGGQVAFALRVDRLGAMLDLERQQLQALHIQHRAAPSMIEAVVRLDHNAHQAPGVLCQISKAWLQHCVGGIKGEISPLDLGPLHP